MTTLAEMVNDVYTITNRPDLSVETTLAVRAATLKAHQSDYYYKDVYEQGVVFIEEEYLQTFNVRDIVPRWRALKYLRKCDVDLVTGDAVPGHFLEILTPEQTLDSYNQHRNNICYMAGLDCKIRTDVAWSTFLMGCYVHPTVLADNYQSWIADEYPLAILYSAAGQVFKMIGQDEKRATFNELAMEEIASLKRSNIVAHGY